MVLRLKPGAVRLETTDYQGKPVVEIFKADSNFNELGKFHLNIQLGKLNVGFTFNFDGVSISNEQFFRDSRLRRTEEGRLNVSGLLRIGNDEFVLAGDFGLDPKKKNAWQTIPLE